jgi:hypothetical protein
MKKYHPSCRLPIKMMQADRKHRHEYGRKKSLLGHRTSLSDDGLMPFDVVFLFKTGHGIIVTANLRRVYSPGRMIKKASFLIEPFIISGGRA